MIKVEKYGAFRSGLGKLRTQWKLGEIHCYNVIFFAWNDMLFQISSLLYYSIPIFSLLMFKNRYTKIRDLTGPLVSSFSFQEFKYLTARGDAGYANHHGNDVRKNGIYFI